MIKFDEKTHTYTNELAKYLKKSVGELTDEEVMANVERKRAKLQAK